MQLRPLLLFSTVLCSSATALAAGGNFDRRLSVTGAPSVSVYTSAGSLHLRAGSDAEVHVVAHLYTNGNGWWGGSSGDLQGRIDSLLQHPPIVQNGNEIVIGERHDGDRTRNVTIDYEITLPRGSKIEAGTGSGDIESQDVGSVFKADSGSGSVRLRQVHGPAMLQTGSGDIELEESGAGEVRAQTGSGSIRLRQINGPLHAQTGSGDIEASGQITGESRLVTGSGSVRLNLGPNPRYTLDATTGSGTVRTEPPIATQDESNRHHVTGAVNGGGAPIRIITGSGDIEIR